MENNEILSDLIVWGIGFIITQVCLFIWFIYKMNIKLEKIRTQIDLDKVNLEIRLAEDKKNFELRFLEIETDMEDHRIAYENRIKEVSDSLLKHYDNFHNENNVSHNAIMKAIDFIKNTVTKIQENLAYMSGTLDMHIGNGANHEKRIPPKRKLDK